eukprot:gene11607-14772_t
MKVNVEVTCTPEEARAFMGLPDIKPMQDRIMGEIEERLRSSLGAMNPETIFKTWLPASMQGMDQMQQMQQVFWRIIMSQRDKPADPKPYYEAHVFCCTNRRPAGHPRGCCAERGGEALRDHMKSKAKALGLKN